MSAGTFTRRTSAADPDADRARKRAAFIANLRRPATRTAIPVRTATRPAATRVIEASAARPTVPAPVAPAASHVPSAAPAAARLFRDQALKHRLSAEEGKGLVRVAPPWTWALLWCVVAALAAAIVTSFVGQVEVTSRGRGIVRPTKGVRALTAQLTGVVSRVAVRSGDRVQAGATLLEIASPTTEAELLQADRELEAVKTQYAAFAVQVDRHYADQVALLKARARRVEAQIASLHESAARRERRVEAEVSLSAKGFASEMGVAATREELADVERQIGAAELSLDQTRQELASLEARRQDELWQRQELVRSAQTKRDALAVVLEQAVVPAPADGTVEALMVRPGETVQAAQVLGKLVPAQSSLHVVSFLAERDRAFVRAGDEVQLELDQLPHAEYGTLRARIARIGDDLASAQELRDAFGEEAKLETPSYRVELRITDSSATEAAGVKLRTGTLMNVRFTLRKQKLITLVFAPLKRWVG